MNKSKKAGAGLAALLSLWLLLPGGAEASEYRASTDTGADYLDFLENRRRLRRENAYTEDQKALLEATQEMKEHLRHPVDATKAAPVAFEGDSLTYDQVTGEFTAEGKVHIIQMDGHQFDAVDGLVTGNLKSEEVRVPGQAHILQITPGMPRVTLDGFNTFYRYGARTGTMGEARGKVDYQYVSGKRFEFYPDRVVIYDATTTKCGAKKPDYHLSGDKITIYPNDKLIVEHVRFWLKDVVLYSRDRYEQSISPGQSAPQYPRVGYNNSDGVWLEQDLTADFDKGLSATAHVYVNTREGFRGSGTLDWQVPHSHFQLAYGYYEDSSDNWIKRNPSFRYFFNTPLGMGSHLNFGAEYEIGRWIHTSRDIESTHSYYRVGLSREPIPLGRDWFLMLSAGYSITHESYNDSTVRGWNWKAASVKEFDDRWAAYLAYVYSTNTSANSLFDYDLDDYSRKGEAGFSYRLSENDRVVMGLAYNMGQDKLADVDYYWFHDLHCSQVITRYRAKRHSLNLTWQFTPW